MIPDKKSIEEAAKKYCLENEYYREIDLNGEGATQDEPLSRVMKICTDIFGIAIDTILAGASEGFKEYAESNPEYFLRISTANCDHGYSIWQAATLAAEKRHQEELLQHQEDLNRAHYSKQELSSKLSKSQQREKILKEALEISSRGETQFDGVEAMHAAREALKAAEEIK